MSVRIEWDDHGLPGQCGRDAVWWCWNNRRGRATLVKVGSIGSIGNERMIHNNFITVISWGMFDYSDTVLY